MTSFQQAKFEVGLFLTISKNLWTSRGLALKFWEPAEQQTWRPFRGWFDRPRPRILRLLGQRAVAGRDSGVLERLFLDHPRRPRGSLSGQRDFHRRKFTTRAGEPLGTYPYRTSSRSVWNPAFWLARKIFFWPISEEEQPGYSHVFLHEVVFLIERHSSVARSTGTFFRRASEKINK